MVARARVSARCSAGVSLACEAIQVLGLGELTRSASTEQHEAP
ncbi:MAG: hypothetical protein ACI9TF_000005 [Paracrocinitomix sp.]|jgi:hypothetical protein